MLNTVQPPGPTLQWLNALLHREPFSSIFYCVFWAVTLTVGPIVAIHVLIISTVVQVGAWWLGWNSEIYFSPKKRPEYEMCIVVTGCDTGFGTEIALRAAEAGFTVFAGCLNDKSFEQFRLVSNIIPIKMDITSDKEVAEVCSKVADWLSGPPNDARKQRVLHAVVNNAGAGVLGEVDWIGVDDFKRLMDINFIGLVRVSKAFLPMLLRQSIEGHYKSARYVNMCSMAGLLPFGALHVAYSATKQACHAFSINLRMEMKPFNIHVSTLNPSFHETPIMCGHYDFMMAAWNKIPQEKKKFYGLDYTERYMDTAINFPISLRWKADVVIEQMMLCLQKYRPPTELLIGTDARTTVVLRMLPSAWTEWILHQILPHPTPAILLSKK